MFAWNDVYQCADCGEQFDAGIVLEAIPWGEHPDGEPNTTRVYPGVRHPNFRDASGDDDDEDSWSDEPDGSCRGCGAYALSGLLRDGCRSPSRLTPKRSDHRDGRRSGGSEAGPGPVPAAAWRSTS